MNLTRKVLSMLLVGLLPTLASGKDYFLTIGGGFSPQGNQASLEANVLFYQQLIREKHTQEAEHKIFFADGFEQKKDLQIVAPKPVAASPAIELLNAVFDLNRDRITYRNHEVPAITGSIAPSEVQTALDVFGTRLTQGDRLIVYVTAHGSAATGSDKMDTSIACWNQKAIRMTAFAKWLDQVPENVPVILIMAQCYCGGFANTMFDQGDPDNGLAKNLRVGFFAQRNDLPAAGCRPDIENDEEYSSYFWGAFLGRLRSGSEVSQIDCNQDGRVSFAEAHGFAVSASPTIDIPLRTSEEFLRRYSRILDYDTLPLGEEAAEAKVDAHDMLRFDGTIASVADMGSPELRQCVRSLASSLEIPPTLSISQVVVMRKECENEFNQSRPRSGRGVARGPRGARNSKRRDFKQELLAKWPELEDPSKWEELNWLKANECEVFLDQVRQLSNYEPFQQSLQERTQTRERTNSTELRLVRLRRLVYSIETILLAKNLPRVANVELTKKYQEIVGLEESFFEQ